jgi:hypothetical protein
MARCKIGILRWSARNACCVFPPVLPHRNRFWRGATGNASRCPDAAAQRQFFCTFETSPTDCGFFEQKKADGQPRAKIVGIGRDGATAVRLPRGPTLYAGMGCYLKLAHYHTPTPASSIIHDRVVRGTTAASVSPEPLQR